MESTAAGCRRLPAAPSAPLAAAPGTAHHCGPPASRHRKAWEKSSRWGGTHISVGMTGWGAKAQAPPRQMLTCRCCSSMFGALDTHSKRRLHSLKHSRSAPIGGQQIAPWVADR